MCYTVRVKYMVCRHKDTSTTRCGKYCEETHKQDKQKASRLGFWCFLASSSPPSHKHTYGKQVVQDYCSNCTAENEMFKDFRRTADDELKERNLKDAEKRVEKQNNLNRQSTQRKKYICTTCRVEGRDPTLEARVYNSGLCCARGIEEFEERFGVGVYGRSNTQSKSSATNNKKAVSRFNTVPHLTSKKQMQHTASAASRTYGWKDGDRDSSALDPKLVHDFIILSGTRAYYLPPPPQVPQSLKSFATRGLPVREPGVPTPIHDSRARTIPMNKDPTGIDWSRWGHTENMFHGQYRAPGTPPQKPLPQPPLRSKTGAKFNDSRQIIDRGRPVKPSYDGSAYGPIEPSLASLVEQSKVDPETLRHVASHLDAPLNDAYKAWNSTARTIAKTPIPRRR